MTHTRYIDAMPEDWNVGRAEKAVREAARVKPYSAWEAALGLFCLITIIAVAMCIGYLWGIWDATAVPS